MRKLDIKHKLISLILLLILLCPQEGYSLAPRSQAAETREKARLMTQRFPRYIYEELVKEMVTMGGYERNRAENILRGGLTWTDGVKIGFKEDSLFEIARDVLNRVLERKRRKEGRPHRDIDIDCVKAVLEYHEAIHLCLRKNEGLIMQVQKEIFSLLSGRRYEVLLKYFENQYGEYRDKDRERDIIEEMVVNLYVEERAFGNPLRLLGDDKEEVDLERFAPQLITIIKIPTESFINSIDIDKLQYGEILNEMYISRHIPEPSGAGMPSDLEEPEEPKEPAGRPSDLEEPEEPARGPSPVPMPAIKPIKPGAKVILRGSETLGTGTVIELSPQENIIAIDFPKGGRKKFAWAFVNRRLEVVSPAPSLPPEETAGPVKLKDIWTQIAALGDEIERAPSFDAKKKLMEKRNELRAELWKYLDSTRISGDLQWKRLSGELEIDMSELQTSILEYFLETNEGDVPKIAQIMKLAEGSIDNLLHGWSEKIRLVKALAKSLRKELISDDERLAIVRELLERYLSDHTFPGFSFSTLPGYFEHEDTKGEKKKGCLIDLTYIGGRRVKISEGILEHIGKDKEVIVSTEFDPDYGWLFLVRAEGRTLFYKKTKEKDSLDLILDPAQETIVDSIEPKNNIFGAAIKPRPLPSKEFTFRYGQRVIAEMARCNKFGDSSLKLYPFRMEAGKPAKRGMFNMGKIKDTRYATGYREVALHSYKLIPGQEYNIAPFFSTVLGRWVFIATKKGTDTSQDEHIILVFSAKEIEKEIRLYQLEREGLDRVLDESGKKEEYPLLGQLCMTLDELKTLFEKENWKLKKIWQKHIRDKLLDKRICIDKLITQTGMGEAFKEKFNKVFLRSGRCLTATAREFNLFLAELVGIIKALKINPEEIEYTEPVLLDVLGKSKNEILDELDGINWDLFLLRQRSVKTIPNKKVRYKDLLKGIGIVEEFKGEVQKRVAIYPSVKDLARSFGLTQDLFKNLLKELNIEIKPAEPEQPKLSPEETFTDEMLEEEMKRYPYFKWTPDEDAKTLIWRFLIKLRNRGIIIDKKKLLKLYYKILFFHYLAGLAEEYRELPVEHKKSAICIRLTSVKLPFYKKLVMYWSKYEDLFTENPEKIKEILGFGIDYKKDIFRTKSPKRQSLIDWLLGIKDEIPAGFNISVFKDGIHLINNKTIYLSLYENISSIKDRRRVYITFAVRDGNKIVQLWKTKEQKGLGKKPLMEYYLVKDGNILAQKINGKKTGLSPESIGVEKTQVEKIEEFLLDNGPAPSGHKIKVDSNRAVQLIGTNRVRLSFSARFGRYAGEILWAEYEIEGNNRFIIIWQSEDEQKKPDGKYLSKVYLVKDGDCFAQKINGENTGRKPIEIEMETEESFALEVERFISEGFAKGQFEGVEDYVATNIIFKHFRATKDTSKRKEILKTFYTYRFYEYLRKLRMELDKGASRGEILSRLRRKYIQDNKLSLLNGLLGCYGKYQNVFINLSEKIEEILGFHVDYKKDIFRTKPSKRQYLTEWLMGVKDEIPAGFYIIASRYAIHLINTKTMHLFLYKNISSIKGRRRVYITFTVKDGNKIAQLWKTKEENGSGKKPLIEYYLVKDGVCLAQEIDGKKTGRKPIVVEVVSPAPEEPINLTQIEKFISFAFKQKRYGKMSSGNTIYAICRHFGIKRGTLLSKEVARIFFTYKFFEYLKGLRKELDQGASKREILLKINRDYMQKHNYALLFALVRHYGFNYGNVFSRNKDRIRQILGFDVDYKRDIRKCSPSEIRNWLSDTSGKVPVPEGFTVVIDKSGGYTLSNSKDLYIRLVGLNPGTYRISFEDSLDKRSKYVCFRQNDRLFQRYKIVKDGVIQAQKKDGKKTKLAPIPLIITEHSHAVRKWILEDGPIPEGKEMVVKEYGWVIICAFADLFIAPHTGLSPLRGQKVWVSFKEDESGRNKFAILWKDIDTARNEPYGYLRKFYIVKDGIIFSRQNKRHPLLYTFRDENKIIIKGETIRRKKIEKGEHIDLLVKELADSDVQAARNALDVLRWINTASGLERVRQLLDEAPVNPKIIEEALKFYELIISYQSPTDEMLEEIISDYRGITWNPIIDKNKLRKILNTLQRKGIRIDRKRLNGIYYRLIFFRYLHTLLEKHNGLSLPQKKKAICKELAPKNFKFYGKIVEYCGDYKDIFNNFSDRIEKILGFRIDYKEDIHKYRVRPTSRDSLIEWLIGTNEDIPAGMYYHVLSNGIVQLILTKDWHLHLSRNTDSIRGIARAYVTFAIRGTDKIAQVWENEEKAREGKHPLQEYILVRNGEILAQKVKGVLTKKSPEPLFKTKNQQIEEFLLINGPPPNPHDIYINKNGSVRLIQSTKLQIYFSADLTSHADKRWATYEVVGNDKLIILWVSEDESKKPDGKYIRRVYLVKDGVCLAQKIDGKKTKKKPIVVEEEEGKPEEDLWSKILKLNEQVEKAASFQERRQLMDKRNTYRAKLWDMFSSRKIEGKIKINEFAKESGIDPGEFSIAIYDYLIERTQGDIEKISVLTGVSPMALKIFMKRNNLEGEIQWVRAIVKINKNKELNEEESMIAVRELLGYLNDFTFPSFSFRRKILPVASAAGAKRTYYIRLTTIGRQEIIISEGLESEFSKVKEVQIITEFDPKQGWLFKVTDGKKVLRYIKRKDKASLDLIEPVQDESKRVPDEKLELFRREVWPMIQTLGEQISRAKTFKEKGKLSEERNSHRAKLWLLLKEINPGHYMEWAKLAEMLGVSKDDLQRVVWDYFIEVTDGDTLKISKLLNCIENSARNRINVFGLIKKLYLVRALSKVKDSKELDDNEMAALVRELFKYMSDTTFPSFSFKAVTGYDSGRDCCFIGLTQIEGEQVQITEGLLEYIGKNQKVTVSTEFDSSLDRWLFKVSGENKNLFYKKHPFRNIFELLIRIPEGLEKFIEDGFDKGAFKGMSCAMAIGTICKRFKIKPEEIEYTEVTRLFYTYMFFENLKGLRRELDSGKTKEYVVEKLSLEYMKKNNKALMDGIIENYGNYENVFTRNKDRIKEILGFEIDYFRDIHETTDKDIYEWITKSGPVPKGKYGLVDDKGHISVCDMFDWNILVISPPGSSMGQRFWITFQDDKSGQNRFAIIWKDREDTGKDKYGYLLKFYIVKDGKVFSRQAGMAPLLFTYRDEEKVVISGNTISRAEIAAGRNIALLVKELSNPDYNAAQNAFESLRWVRTAAGIDSLRVLLKNVRGNPKIQDALMLFYELLISYEKPSDELLEEKISSYPQIKWNADEDEGLLAQVILPDLQNQGIKIDRQRLFKLYYKLFFFRYLRMLAEEYKKLPQAQKKEAVCARLNKKNLPFYEGLVEYWGEYEHIFITFPGQITDILGFSIDYKNDIYFATVPGVEGKESYVIVGLTELKVSEIAVGKHNAYLLRCLDNPKTREDAKKALKLMRNEELIIDLLRAMDPGSVLLPVVSKNMALLEILESIGIINEQILQRVRIFTTYGNALVQRKAGELYSKFKGRKEELKPEAVPPPQPLPATRTGAESVRDKISRVISFRQFCEEIAVKKDLTLDAKVELVKSNFPEFSSEHIRETLEKLQKPKTGKKKGDGGGRGHGGSDPGVFMRGYDIAGFYARSSFLYRFFYDYDLSLHDYDLILQDIETLIGFDLREDPDPRTINRINLLLLKLELGRKSKRQRIVLFSTRPDDKTDTALGMLRKAGLPDDIEIIHRGEYEHKIKGRYTASAILEHAGADKYRRKEVLTVETNQNLWEILDLEELNMEIKYIDKGRLPVDEKLRQELRRVGLERLIIEENDGSYINLSSQISGPLLEDIDEERLMQKIFDDEA